jgi:hypothetical protein
MDYEQLNLVEQYTIIMKGEKILFPNLPNNLISFSKDGYDDIDMLLNFISAKFRIPS